MREREFSRAKAFEYASQRRPLLPLPPREGIDEPHERLGEHRSLPGPWLTFFLLLLRASLGLEVVVRTLFAQSTPRPDKGGINGRQT